MRRSATPARASARPGGRAARAAREAPLHRPAVAEPLAGDAVERERDDPLELVRRGAIALEAAAERIDDRPALAERSA